MHQATRRDPMRYLVVATVALGLAGCAGAPRPGPGSGAGTYKIGKPYQVHGVWYYPAEDYSYDETGIASWYGPGFHKDRTANGEVFDQNEMTAAHKTLPMPSLVRVTNLDNGRSVVVRVNDRGPFVVGRILDMSRRCAELLGFKAAGTAKVRVRILADESRAMAAGSSGTAGRYLPAPVVAHQPVTGARQIYVQAGAFAQYNNASRLRDKVAGIAPTTITAIEIGGTRFFRVRLGPIKSVDRADDVLSRALEAGSAEARLVVD